MSDIEHTQYQAVLIDAVVGTVEQRACSWKEAQAFVGGWLELVRYETYDLYVNEEGRLLDLPFGFAIDGVQYVGNGVIFGHDGPELADATDAPRAVVLLRKAVTHEA